VDLEGWKFENTPKYVGLEGWDLKKPGEARRSGFGQTSEMRKTDEATCP
jgi:hypothetical protein